MDALTVASRMGANFQSSNGVVARVGRPEMEGMDSAFLNSLLGELSMACARTILAVLAGTAERREVPVWERETFIVVAIEEIGDLNDNQ